MKRRAGAFLAAMFMDLPLVAPFLPTVAQDVVCDCEESVDGAGLAALGTNGAVVAWN